MAAAVADSLTAHMRDMINITIRICAPRPLDWMSTDAFMAAWAVHTPIPFPGLWEGDGLGFFYRLQRNTVLMLYWPEPGRVLLRMHPNLVHFLQQHQTVPVPPPPASR